MPESNNPLKQFMNFRRDELPQILLMFCYFFLVITSFWILKPLKKSIFVQFYQTSGSHIFGCQWMRPRQS